MSVPAHAAAARTAHRAFACAAIVLFAAACTRGDDAELRATPDDVDAGGDPYVTDRELAAFRPPADGTLTAVHVDMYLKTSLLQFDLVRQQSVRLHEQAQRIEARGEQPGVIGGLRNIAEVGRFAMGAVDLIGGSYVRSARTLGYNPAELEWIAERMAEATGYFATEQMQQAGSTAADEMRAQARELERQAESGAGAYISSDMIQQMLEQADEMERSLAAHIDTAARANAEVLRRAKSDVTEAMWLRIGWHGGGLAGWAGLADPADADAQRRLDEYRTIFEDALANRVTPGMESTTAED